MHSAPWVAMLLLAVVAGSARATTEIVIGVISPTKVGRSIGTAHEETILFARDHLGDTIQAGTVEVPLRFDNRSDRGDPDTAVSEARALVEAGAVAILGPVDSRCTEAILRANLQVPVLSALSTAPSLSDPRDPWFFRITLSDDERIRQYLKTLRKYEGMMPDPRVVLYEAGPYGEGLRDAVVKELALPADLVLPWSDLVPDGEPTDQGRDALETGQGFLPAGIAKLKSPGTVFILGSSAQAARIGKGVEAVVHDHGGARPHFYFVGDDSELRTGAPQDSYTIGEPTIIDVNGSVIGDVRKAFARTREQDAESFVVTAYEAAYYILPRAISEAIGQAPQTRQYGSSSDGDTELPQPAVLRVRLRDALETLEFESMEPWRRIQLRGGALSGAPVVPVYRIRPSLDLVEIPDPKPWVEVEAPPAMGFLEGPVTMRVLPHGLEEGLNLKVLRIDVKPFEVVSFDEKPLPNGGKEVSFYPFRPGEYRVETPLPTDPANPHTVVGLGMGYVMALGGALLGSLLFALASTERGESVSRRRIALGVLAGLVLAGLAINRAILPESMAAAVPVFGKSPRAAALWAGLVGGWAGPGILLLLLRPFLPGTGEQERRKEPAGPAGPASASDAQPHPH